MPLDDVTEYANLLEDLLVDARPTFAELKRLAERAGITYHFPTTGIDEIHELVIEATRSAESLDRLIDQLSKVLPHIGSHVIARLRDARPDCLKTHKGIASLERSREIGLKPQSRPHVGPDPPSGLRNPAKASAATTAKELRIDVEPEGKGNGTLHTIQPDACNESLAPRRDVTSLKTAHHEGRSDAIRAAWIAGWFVVAAAIVGALLTALLTNGFGLLPEGHGGSPGAPAPRATHSSPVVGNRKS